ncbi:MAG: ERF family protein [Bacteroidota bacterium]
MSTTELQAIEQTPMTLIAAAIEHGADPDRLENLLALQERWGANQAEKAYAAAMHAAQQEMPTVVRDAENSQTRSKYALLESVQKQCKPIYEKHGLSLSFGEADCEAANHKRTTCDVRHVDGACHSYHLDLPIDGVGPKGNAIGGMNAVQGAISTTSYAQRRLVCMIFNVTIAGDDDDGASASPSITGEQVAILNGLLDRIHPDDKELDNVLRFAKVDALDKLPLRLFGTVKRGLEQKAAAYQ